MNNSQHFPFERNRYYAGKMLTSNDFQAEQTYFNNKRRFINNLMYGSGIVCGCSVISLDDLSVLIESGVAIDDLGREIIIETSVVEKLSAIEGFDSLRTNDVTLCLQYVENPVHSVYSINQKESEKEYEYNRIVEGFKLFLMDSEDIPKSFAMEDEFITRGVLYADDDYMLELISPSVLCKGKNAKVIAQITKLSNSEKSFSYHATIQAPGFVIASGAQEFDIDFDHVNLPMGETVKKEIWANVQDNSGVETSFILKSGTAKAEINGENVSAMSGFSLKVLLSNHLPVELVGREIGRMSFEMKYAGAKLDYIALCELKLVRTDSAYIIEEVRENDVKKYISAPSQEMLRNSYMDFYRKDVDITAGGSVPVIDSGKGRVVEAPARSADFASGTFEIPLGENARAGQIIYSSEIMHGMGKGNFYVDVGLEFVADDAALGKNARNTIYGPSELFEADGNSVPRVTTAVKVNNDKGSFVVAIRLEEDPDYIILSGRWVAVKFPSGTELDMAEDYTGKSISALTPTVVIGTKESHYFGVSFNNMQPSTLEYELKEPGSGEISPDGIYTAPSKEGVYEIMIYCVDAPSIFTYAYAIVKKKGFDNE